MNQELSDADLLIRLRDGTQSQKKEILITLYERYKHLVLKLCYYHLGDYDLADDAFHDVFVKVIENAETIRNPAIFKSWLMTIARNLCVDRLRHSSYLKGQESGSARIEVSCEERVEDRYIAEIDRQKILGCLAACLKNMDPVHLSIFKLRWSGLRAAQILKIQKIDNASLRRSYDRIKELLEGCMKSKGFKISIEQILLLGELDE
jgi:RNA polymerase sigma factor (sigma-70 family)